MNRAGSRGAVKGRGGCLSFYCCRFFRLMGLGPKSPQRWPVGAEMPERKVSEEEESAMDIADGKEAHAENAPFMLPTCKNKRQNACSTHKHYTQAYTHEHTNTSSTLDARPRASAAQGRSTTPSLTCSTVLLRFAISSSSLVRSSRVTARGPSCAHDDAARELASPPPPPLPLPPAFVLAERPPDRPDSGADVGTLPPS